MDTSGMHAASCVLMGYLRPAVLKLFSPRGGYEFGTQPTVQYLGLPWFMSYAGILILSHHLLLFFLEIFRFSEFFSTFLRAMISSIVTLFLVIVTQYLFYGKKNED